MLISTQFWNSLLFRGCVYSTLLTYIVPLLDNTLGVNLFSLVLHRYFIAVQKCLGLYSENGQYCTNVDRLCTLYISHKKEYGWSSAVKRMPLDFLGGEKFQEAADNYVRPLLTKGVPSLFSDLSPLYEQPGKVYSSLLADFFVKNSNRAVFEIELKWYRIEAEQGKLNYKDSDELLEFFQKRSILAGCHFLFRELEDAVQL
uniref:Uncharacterized protein n=1 Tax=Oryza rufipogon TaxID=4529 RepID=A0A0E0PS84_ORYRU